LVVALAPGRGAFLPEPLDPLMLDAPEGDAQAALARVAETIGVPEPEWVLGNGFGVDVGHGRLSVTCVDYRDDGVDRTGELTVARGSAWRGSPELRARLEGIDLLHEPAADVTWLLRELGYDTRPQGGGRWWLPDAAVTLSGWDGHSSGAAFSGVTIWSPAFYEQRDHWRF
jgi:hypothetical protein